MKKSFYDLLDEYAPAIRDAIIAGVRDIQDNAILAQVESMVERRDIEGALRALGYNPAVFNTVIVATTQAFEAGGLLMMASLPKYVSDASGMRTMLRFNVRDRDAEQWLRDRSSGLIVGIEDDIRQNVRDTLEDGLAAGRNPRSVALDIVGRYDRTTGHREGGVVGLDPMRAGWARSARTRLLNLDEGYFEMELRDKRFDDTVRAAIRDGRPLPVETVDKLVNRYRARALQARGESIGRTEALAALNRSEYEATMQALRQSGKPLSAAEKIWDSAGDNRVRNSHRELDGVRVAINEPFISPASGMPMMHPGDTSMGATGKDVIGCRCRIRYKVDYAYGVE